MRDAEQHHDGSTGRCARSLQLRSQIDDGRRHRDSPPSGAKAPMQHSVATEFQCRHARHAKAWYVVMV
jgi:hypothetical protein